LNLTACEAMITSKQVQILRSGERGGDNQKHYTWKGPISFKVDILPFKIRKNE